MRDVEKLRATRARYEASEKGRVTRARYDASDARRESNRRWYERLCWWERGERQFRAWQLRCAAREKAYDGRDTTYWTDNLRPALGNIDKEERLFWRELERRLSEEEEKARRGEPLLPQREVVRAARAAVGYWAGWPDGPPVATAEVER